MRKNNYTFNEIKNAILRLNDFGSFPRQAAILLLRKAFERLETERKDVKLTKEILLKLDFKKKGGTWTRWKLDLLEDEDGIFSFNGGRIYFEVDTVEELQDLWIAIGAESVYPLNTSSLQSTDVF